MRQLLVERSRRGRYLVASLAGCPAAAGARLERRCPRRVTGFTADSANDSERLALERMLGLGLERYAGRRPAAIQCPGARPVRRLPLRLARPRRARATRSASTSRCGARRGGWSRSDWATTTSWAGGCGRARWTAGSSGWPSRVARPSFSTPSGRSCPRGFAGSSRSCASYGPDASPLRLATEDVRQFDADGDELDGAGDPGGDRIRRRGAGVPRRMGDRRSGFTGTCGTSPARDDLSTLGRRGARDPGEPDPRARGASRGRLDRGLSAREARGGAVRPARRGAVHAQGDARLGRRPAAPARVPARAATTDFPGSTSASAAATAKRCSACCFTTPLKGPLLARVEFAGGRTAIGGSLLGEDGWVGGVRAGIGADTPVGPVRFEYGYSTEDRGAVFVRLGDWF